MHHYLLDLNFKNYPGMLGIASIRYVLHDYYTAISVFCATGENFRNLN